MAWIGAEPKATEDCTKESLKNIRVAREKGMAEHKGYSELEEEIGFNAKALVHHSRALERCPT